MRYFLVILLGGLSFFASAQDVTIPAPVARFFLEQHDRAIILAKKDSVNKKEIKNLNLLVQVTDSVIFRYQSDSVIYRGLIATQQQLTRTVEDENKILTKRVNLLSFKSHLLTGTTAGALTGSAVPLIGTVAGTAIGAAGGTIVWLVKSITRSHGR